MALFIAPTLPALNASGQGKITFTGLSIKQGISKQGKAYILNSLGFEVMGKVRGTNLSINIISGQIFDIGSEFCIALVKMGLNPEILEKINDSIYESELETDDDGFEVESCVEDNDGFAIADEIQIDFTEVENFCQQQINKIFLGKVKKNDNKFWELDAKSLIPFIKPKKDKSKKIESESVNKTED